MNATIITDMEKLDKAIKESKNNKAILEGRRTEVVDQMQKKFGVSKVDDLSSLIETAKIELEELESEVEAAYKKIKTKYNW